MPSLEWIPSSRRRIAALYDSDRGSFRPSLALSQAAFFAVRVGPCVAQFINKPTRRDSNKLHVHHHHEEEHGNMLQTGSTKEE